MHGNNNLGTSASDWAPELTRMKEDKKTEEKDTNRVVNMGNEVGTKSSSLKDLAIARAYIPKRRHP